MNLIVSKLKLDVASVHGGEKSFKSKFYIFCFASNNTLTRFQYMKERSQSNVNFLTITVHKMTQQIISVHEKNKSFKCKFCENRFSKRMKKHVARIHVGK